MNEQLTSIEAVLAASLNPGSIRDTSLYAFSSKAKSNGVVKIHRPRPVIVVGSVLERTAPLARLVGLAFSEPTVDLGEIQLQAQRPLIRQVAHATEYDYETDSDLDEDEQDDVELASELGSSSEDMFDPSVVGTDDCEVEGVRTLSQDTSKYRAVMVPNVAFRTLRAGVFFMYTGKVRFLPLRSQGIEKRQNELSALDSLGIPASSPKSLYRFADIYEMKDLRARAANAITHRLSPENIVDEVFSSFFCRYDDLHMRAMSIIGLLYDDPVVQESLKRLIPKLIKGELPHAEPTLVMLLQMQTIDSSRRVGRIQTELAAEPAPEVHDEPHPLGPALNASAQSFQPMWPPLAAPAYSFGAPEPSPTKTQSDRSILRSPISRPGAPGPSSVSPWEKPRRR